MPLSVIALVLGARRLPRTSVTSRPDGRSLASLDLPGIALFAATLVSLLLFLMTPRVGDWYVLVLSVAAATGFAVRELRVREPFLDLRVLGGNVRLLATYARMLLAMTVAYSFLYGYTQWMEDSHGLSAARTGLLLLPIFVTAILVSTTTGRRKQIRGKLLAGAVAQIGACLLLLVVHADSAIWLLALVSLVVGIPQGLNNLANQNAVYYQADPDRMGSSAGLLRTFMYLGAIVASAATGAAFPHTADTAGLHHLAVFMLGVAVLLLAVTVADRSLGRVGRPAETGADAVADTTRHAVRR